MTDDKIAEVRKRHAFAEENKSVIRPSGFGWTIPGWQAHNDRATLRAEVERLRAEMCKIEYLDRPQVRELPRRVTIQQIALDALAGGKDD